MTIVHQIGEFVRIHKWRLICGIVIVLMILHAYHLKIESTNNRDRLARLKKEAGFLSQATTGERRPKRDVTARKQGKENRLKRFVVDPRSPGCMQKNETTVEVVTFVDETSPLHTDYKLSTTTITTRRGGVYFVHAQILLGHPDATADCSFYKNKKKHPIIRDIVARHYQTGANGTTDTYYMCRVYGLVHMHKCDTITFKLHGVDTAVYCKKSLSFFEIFRM